MNNVSETGSDFIHDLGDAVRKNPVSAALIRVSIAVCQWRVCCVSSGSRMM